MRRRRGAFLLGLVAAAATGLAGCATGPGASLDAGPVAAAPSSGGDATGTTSPAPDSPQGDPSSSSPPATSGSPKAGTPTPARSASPSARAAVAKAPAGPRSTRVVGSGTPAGCTSDAVVAAVAAGGVVTFDCGPSPVVITMTRTAKVVNTHPDLVLDGGGKVTLSGGGTRRILYQNTCDQAQQWTTSHCDDQETPRLTVKNLRFLDGNSTSDGEGGGAIFVRGGQLTVQSSRFEGNRCAARGSDLGGAAIRVFDQYQDRPVQVSGSTFTGGRCANGGAISSIGVSWVVTGSTFTGNVATGTGASSGQGGNGGAIYLDGNRMTLTVRSTRIQGNTANEGGGAIFFVSNDRTGTMAVVSSTLRGNPSKGFETAGLPGIFFLGARTPSTAGSTLAR